jgi:hypothetical protein
MSVQESDPCKTLPKHIGSGKCSAANRNEIVYAERITIPDQSWLTLPTRDAGDKGLASEDESAAARMAIGRANNSIYGPGCLNPKRGCQSRPSGGACHRGRCPLCRQLRPLQYELAMGRLEAADMEWPRKSSREAEADRAAFSFMKILFAFAHGRERRMVPVRHQQTDR